MATYADLEVITKTYKEVNGHRILLDVLVPQDLKPGPNPLILSFHGGWFVAGSRNFLPFFPTWLPEFATRHSAIIISADYRLLPEASGAEILEDLESVWRWVHDSLQSVLTDHFAHKPGHTADLGRIMLYGGSAGGYCALQLALSHPDEVQALMMAYPMADVDGGWNVTGNGGADMLGRAPPSETEVDAFVAENKKPGAVATTGDWDRVRMGIGGQAWGKTRGWLGSGKDVVPFDRIKAGAGLPAKVYVIHGLADDGVSYTGTKTFEELAAEHCPKTIVRAEYYDGKGHGFDNGATLDDQWIADGVSWVTTDW